MHNVVILSKRSASKDLRTDSTYAVMIMRRFLDSLHSLGMTESWVFAYDLSTLSRRIGGGSMTLPYNFGFFYMLILIFN